jgi:hypothetical protein
MQKVKPSNLLKPLVEELNGELFRAWRQAMQAAQSRIELEKARALRQLTPEQSLRLYHALWERSRHLSVGALSTLITRSLPRWCSVCRLYSVAIWRHSKVNPLDQGKPCTK